MHPTCRELCQHRSVEQALTVKFVTKLHNTFLIFANFRFWERLIIAIWHSHYSWQINNPFLKTCKCIFVCFILLKIHLACSSLNIRLWQNFLNNTDFTTKNDIQILTFQWKNDLTAQRDDLKAVEKNLLGEIHQMKTQNENLTSVIADFKKTTEELTNEVSCIVVTSLNKQPAFIPNEELCDRLPYAWNANFAIVQNDAKLIITSC